MRLASLAFLFCILLHPGIGVAYVGSSSAGSKDDQQPDDFDKLAEIFAPAGTPSIHARISSTNSSKWRRICKTNR